MTELNTEPLSTVIDNDAPAPGAAEYRPEPLAPEPAAEKPMSLDDAIKQAVTETKEKADEPAPKAKDDPKVKEAKPEPKPEKAAPERGENGKFAPKAKEPEESPALPQDGDDAEVEQERGTNRPSEVRDTARAPAHFLPRAKEAWPSTNEDVRAEVHRMVENYEKGLNEYRESHEFRKELKQYEDMAKAEGTTVKEALGNFARIQSLLRSNPTEGIQRVLASINVTPQQYAQHILGQAQQQRDNPQAAQQNQLGQTVQQLQQQIADMQKQAQQRDEESRLQQVAQQFIEPFKAEHPRYDELEADIALFLNSGKIPSTLSKQDRLDAAYDMAVRINPEGIDSQPEPLKPAQNAQRPLNPAGSKSIKGSLTYGAEVPRKSAKLSLDEALKMAARSVHG